MNKYALAVDVGATKVALALVDRQFSVEYKEEVFVKENPHLWNEIAAVTEQLLTHAGGSFIGVGIGSAGPLHLDSGAISPVNIPVWRRFPIVSKFAELTENENVILHGDAMALAHAEFRLGAGRGVSNMLGIIVSTGIGGGLILNDSLYTGETGNAYFIGHHTINFDGLQCACGRLGCVETYASGPRMVAIAQDRGWTGEPSFIALAESARQGNSTALQVIDEGARALAIGIVNSIGSLDIRTVVVGGGVSQAGDVYWNPLRHHIANEARFTDFISDIDLRLAQFQRDTGIVGAALGVLDETLATSLFQNAK
jgi:glucokinase